MYKAFIKNLLEGISIRFLLAAGMLSAPLASIAESDNEVDDAGTLALALDAAEDGEVSEDEESKDEEKLSKAAKKYDEALLLNSKRSPSEMGSISASTSLNSQTAFWIPSIVKHGRKGSAKPMAQSAAVSPVGLVGVPAASGVALVGSLSILESVPVTDEVSMETLVDAEKTVSADATGTALLSLRSFGVSGVTFSSVRWISDIMPMGDVVVSPSEAKSGSTSLSTLATSVDTLKNAVLTGVYHNVPGFPFVPYEDAGYVMRTDGKSYTKDAFWRTEIKRTGSDTWETVDTVSKFYAYATSGVGTAGWYDIYTGEAAPADWSTASRNVAVFGSMGSAEKPVEYEIPSSSVFTLAGMIVGTPSQKSYVNIVASTDSSGGDRAVNSGVGTIIFEKAEADKQYNELAVNIFVYGSVELSGFDSIILNSNVLVNKSTGSAVTGSLILDSPLRGGTSVVNGVEHTNAIYFESTDLTLRASNEEYTGDWYFGMYTAVKFDFQNAANNQFGTGTLNFRGTKVTFAGTEAQLESGDIHVTLSNNVNIDGADGTGTLSGGLNATWVYEGEDINNRGVTVAESSRDAVFNKETNSYNRFYRTISGNISDGSRGVGKFIWANRDKDSMNYKNETWIFTGDNSGYGSTAWYQAYRNDKDYATWDLGTSTYNTANIGIAMPMVFGDGSDFAYKNADGSMKYDAIAGLGGFTAASGTTSALVNGVVESVQGHTGIGFNYSNSVQVNNAIFGTIRVYHLGTGTLELTNTSNTFDAGVWVTNGGTLKVSDLSTLGTGGVNLLDGTLEYTGGSATFDSVIENHSAVARLQNTNSPETGYMDVYEQKHFGDWAVNVTNADATLSWDATKTNSYSTALGVETGVRSGDFTKLGAGTLNVTAGTLVNASKWTYDSNGLGTKNDTAQYRPNVTISAGTLAFTGTASLGDFSTLYMSGGKLSSEANISLNAGQKINLSAQAYTVSNGAYYHSNSDVKLTYVDSLKLSAGTFYDSSAGTGVILDSSSNYNNDFKVYSSLIADSTAGSLLGLIEFKTTAPDGTSNKTNYYYAGQGLYYYDTDNKAYAVVGREKVNGKWVNTTDPAKLLEQLNSSLLGNTSSAAASIFNGNITSLDQIVIKNGDTYISGGITLASGSTATAPTGTAFAGITESVICDVGTQLQQNNETGAIESIATTNPGELHDQLSSSGVLEHSISVGTNATGTLTLAGGTLTYEFTNVSRPDYIVAELPTWNHLEIDGAFGVDAEKGGNIEFVFTNGAMLTEGFYKLLEATSDISSDVIENLKITGISSLPGNTNSRQTIELVLGGGTTTSLGENNVTAGGTANELYAYVTPSTALLHWDTGDGIWEQKNSTNSALADNWASLDSKVFDTNFYENDSVVFCDLNHAADVGEKDGVCDPGSQEPGTTTHTVTISGDVKPLQIIVSAEKDNYIFSGTGSISGEGGLEKFGSGTLTIYTENKFSGGSDISAGTVNALAANALGTGLIHVYESGTLNVGAIAENDFGEKDAVVNGVLMGSIHLESAGTINIFGSNTLNADSTVAVSGGELHANATKSLKNATVNVTGGAVYANAANAFDSSNTITLAGKSADYIAKFYVTVSKGIEGVNIVVGAYSQLFASAGYMNANTITLKHGNSSDERDGALIIDAEHPLEGTQKVVFDNGGVIVLENENTTHNISNFDNYVLKSTGSSFGIATGSNLIVASNILLGNQNVGLKKFGAGTLTFNVDAGKTLAGSINFENSIHAQLGDGSGTVVFNFKADTADGDISKITGHIYGTGTIRTEGGYGEIGAIISGIDTQYFEYAAKFTQTTTRQTYFTESDLAKYKSTTKFVSGEIRINAIAGDSHFYVGTIVNGTSADEIAAEKEVTISSQGYNTNIAVTQNTGSGTLYATVKDNNKITTGLDVHSTGTHVLTLAAQNTSTGTLSVFDKATVEIASGANWAGAINVASGGTLKLHAEIANICSGTTAGTASINISESLENAGTVTLASDSKLVLDLSKLSATELLEKQNENGVVAVKIVASSAIKNYADFTSIDWDGEKFSADGKEITGFDGLSLVNASSVIRDYAFDTATGTLLIAIPEPSLFGALAGLGALALAGTRRRRK